MRFDEQLIAWRRELHQNPELSGQEVETTARLRQWLTTAGITPLPYALQTGVVAEIGTGKKLIALRADIDALPIEERSGVPFSSQRAGVMHASRNVNTLDSVVLSVTRITGGNTWNVLPESVELEGTLRTHRVEVQQNVKARVGEIAAGFASAFSAQIDITWYAGPTALVNDAHWAEFATAVARESGYETQHAELHMGGEDFAVYLQQIPGAFVSIGSASPFGLHHPAFNPDEALIEPAARYFAQLAEKALQHV